MSWAAHNPELWNSIQVNGIVKRMVERLDVSPSTASRADLQASIEDKLMDSGIEYLIFQALADWASKEIAEAESGHFADAADRAHESEIERQLHKEEV